MKLEDAKRRFRKPQPAKLSPSVDGYWREEADRATKENKATLYEHISARLRAMHLDTATGDDLRRLASVLGFEADVKSVHMDVIAAYLRRSARHDLDAARYALVPRYGVPPWLTPTDPPDDTPGPSAKHS